VDFLACAAEEVESEEDKDAQADSLKKYTGLSK
jgi:hypothetical protein